MPVAPASIRPTSKDDQDRWEEQALRGRMLSGQHIPDIEEEIAATFAGEISQDLEVAADPSVNPFKQVSEDLNTAYDENPGVKVLGSDDADLTTTVTPRLWPQMQSVSLDVIGLNEGVLRLDWPVSDDAVPEVIYTRVDPAMVVFWPSRQNPDIPAAAEWLVPRDDPDDPEAETIWTWEVWDVRGEEPVFRIDEIKLSDDGSTSERVPATEKWAPDLVGSYPYIDNSGAPIFPFVLYHKRVGKRLWEWMRGVELTLGSLRAAAYMTHWGDGFVNNASPQMYALDVQAQGGATKSVNGVSVESVPKDRKSILKFKSTGANGGSVGTLDSRMEPATSLEAVVRYIGRLAVHAGLSPSDLSLQHTAQSGYAIVVSRDGKRKAQKRVTPGLTLGDQQTMATAAKLSNAYANTDLPEDPRAYLISYATLKPSLDEQKAALELAKEAKEAGVIDEVELMRRAHPELSSDEEAIDLLLRMERRKIELAQARAALAAEMGADPEPDPDPDPQPPEDE